MTPMTTNIKPLMSPVNHQRVYSKISTRKVKMTPEEADEILTVSQLDTKPIIQNRDSFQLPVNGSRIDFQPPQNKQVRKKAKLSQDYVRPAQRSYMTPKKSEYLVKQTSPKQMQGLG